MINNYELYNIKNNIRKESETQMYSFWGDDLTKHPLYLYYSFYCALYDFIVFFVYEKE
jgi:hypothetical protein